MLRHDVPGLMRSDDIQSEPFKDSDRPEWDAFIKSCPMATFLHSRRFLSYHGDRFKDRSLLFRTGERLLGVLPAAEASGRIVSHPGSTFGGIVHKGELSGMSMRRALESAAVHYKKSGGTALTYKAVPQHCRRLPCDDDLFALHDMGARRTECQMYSVADLSMRIAPSSRRRRGAKKALAAGVSAAEGNKHAASIWNVLSENLRKRHNTAPVHSLKEILLLSDLFPRDISFHAATLGGDVVAAVVIFAFPHVWHAQYIASNETGRGVCALDFLFPLLMDRAATAGMRWFSFGSSSERDGTLNDELYKFKSEFGSGGIAMEHYDFIF